MPRPAILLKRSLIFVHRWLGVALSLLFTLWFVSGIVMMYWSYPEVSAADRLERAPALDPAAVRMSPEEAYAALERDQPPAQVRLSSFDGRPVYRFSVGRGGSATVYADDGSEQLIVDDAMLDRAAAAWTRQPIEQARRETVEEIDQWTLGVRSSFPLYKYSWPGGAQVYLDGDSGEVVQSTTSESRLWAYLGAIPHWLYFTPLRKHGPQWFSFVVWSSGIGTVSALLGVIVGLWMYSPKQRYRHAGAPTSIPYRGWKRWHTLIGLFFGAITVTWAFSGLLSMGPFEFVDRITAWTIPAGTQAPPAKAKGKGKGAGRGPNLAGALRGSGRLPLSAYDAKPPAAALASLPRDFEARELEFTSFDGEPVYLASNGRGETRVVPVAGEPRTEFDPQRIMEMVRATAGPNLAELRVMDSYDAYYLDRTRQAPLPVIYARMKDAVGTRYYIDPKTARVVGNYSARNWVSRWLYHGLHSFDFPWLYNRRPLWDIVVIGLMLGGTGLCVTSLWLAWRVLQRKLAAVLPVWRSAQPSEDLLGRFEL